MPCVRRGSEPLRPRLVADAGVPGLRQDAVLAHVPRLVEVAVARVDANAQAFANGDA